MLSRVFSSPYRVSVTRGLRVGMMTPIPRLFHTSISVSVIHERIRDKTTLKDVAPKAREEMAQSINDTVLPGGSTDADTDTEEDVDPEKHPIETAKRIIQDITEWKYRDHIHDSVVNLIKKDHTNIDRLYRIYQNVTVDANTKLLMGQIIIRESKLSSLKSSRHDGQSHAFEYVMLLPSIYVVCVHSNAEEMSVYPIIDSDISHDQAKQARTAHSSIERLLKELDDLTLWDEEYDYRMKTAIENFRTHVQYEESQLLKCQ